MHSLAKLPTTYTLAPCMPHSELAFDSTFESLTGYTPMAWQRRFFYEILEGNVPSIADIPTGVGKTSVMVLWLLALAEQAAAGFLKLPRRLVYVVDRRTVVDQATDDAELLQRRIASASIDPVLVQVRDALATLCVDPTDKASPLAVSTLRGQLADNRAWQADPCRAAIVIGTVDLIGSRLLFSGYRSGWKMRAFETGLLAHDALLVHDEAHLSAPFSSLVHEIVRIQNADAHGPGEHRALRLLELSATQRGLRQHENTFALSDEEQTELIVRRRIRARKRLRLHDVDDEGALLDRLVRLGIAHAHGRVRVLVYVRTPEQARKIASSLSDQLGEHRVDLLTGTMRGHERDVLASEGGVFPRFRAGPQRPPVDESIYLVSTSAGEVGANLDADHLVCDVSTLDSMIQRAGRVNRLGREEAGFTAMVDAVFAPATSSRRKAGDDTEPEETVDDFEAARRATRRALMTLQRDEVGIDLSPVALRALLDVPETHRAFAPAPAEIHCTDIAFDSWSLTSCRALPGRPPIYPYLHGVESDPPQTAVAWRAEAPELSALLLVSANAFEEWLDVHRVLPRETLSEKPALVANALVGLARYHMPRQRPFNAIVVPLNSDPFSLPSEKLAAGEFDLKALAQQLADATVILPVEVGGLDQRGMLAGMSASRPAADVADLVDQVRTRRRLLLRRGDSGWSAELLGGLERELALPLDPDDGAIIDASRLIASLRRAGGPLSEAKIERCRIVLEEDEDGPKAMLISFSAPQQSEAALESSAGAASDQTLAEHLHAAGAAARRIARRVALPAAESEALERASERHDTGKNRPSWQRAVGNGNLAIPVAKTSHGRFEFAACPGYRHELGSLIDALRDESTAALEERDLMLHLIASHHARGRPGFSEVAWDPACPDAVNEDAVRGSNLRFAALQQRFGRWGLAWREALMKSSDILATNRGRAVSDLAE